jgi:hypothetical protein
VSCSRVLEYRLRSTLCLVTLLAACEEPTVPGGADGAPTSSKASAEAGQQIRHYGVPVRIGNGMARTYIVANTADHTVPLEIGVALSEGALEGLPVAEGGHEMLFAHLLALPVGNPTPYQFVELDWNPVGHEPAIVYGLPHFDFHFYTVSRETRNSIMPDHPHFADQAASLPGQEFRPPFYVDAATAAGAPAALVTVPMMGLHWFDVRSPELQALLGNPAGFQPFTRTFFKGTWDGRFIFDEPMITRAWLLTRRLSNGDAAADEVIPVSTAERYAPAGYYPDAYRIAYDPRSRDFLVGLTELTWRQ